MQAIQAFAKSPEATRPVPGAPPRPLGNLMRMMSMAGLGRPILHPHTPNPAGSQEAPNEQAGDGEKGDVEPRRVVPRDGGLDHPCMALRRDEAESTETHLDDQRRYHHGSVECDEHETGHLQPVVLPIDVQDRNDNQIGEDERDDPAETDAAIPEDRGQWNIPDRADERDDRDERPDDGTPEGSENRMAGQEETLS